MLLHILFEDNHLIAVFKPSEMLTQGDASGDVSLLALTKQWLKEKYQKPGNVFLGMVHRLDKPVAGVVLFAKTSKAAGRISTQFRERTTRKTYWAAVEGVPQRTEARLDVTLGWDEMAKRAVVSDDGKDAALTYRLLRKGATASLLEVDLHTGRKHQIRAQLAHLGHPILGDTKYGAKRSARPGIGLLAKRLRVTHPIKTEETVDVEVPEDLYPMQNWMTT